MRLPAIEGVQDRIDVESADMRALPFEAATFDVVVSSLAIHNIRANADRVRAVREAWRVLKPGGRLAIADIRATRLYLDRVRLELDFLHDIRAQHSFIFASRQAVTP